MTKPDWVDWERVDALCKPEVVSQVQSDMIRRKGELMRITYVEDLAAGEAWLCLEGWEKKPDDQGPQPTASDIPVGFI
jgi:hypothetical protein